jgi:hypothetical protein
MPTFIEKCVLEQFVKDVQTMRDLQKQYFKDREPAVLMMAKTWETVVDKNIAKFTGKQGNLL